MLSLFPDILLPNVVDISQWVEKYFEFAFEFFNFYDLETLSHISTFLNLKTLEICRESIKR